jgi:hypothetical protein
MSASQSLLPAGFEALEAFAPYWAVAGTAERDRLRGESSEAQRLAFYNACKDLLAPGLASLDRKPLAEFSEQEQRLMNLLLSFAHVSIAVEIQRDAEAGHAQNRKHLRITRAIADVT